MIKKGGYVLLIVLLAIVGWYWPLIYYGYTQARGQLEVVWNARPVREYLDDRNTSDPIRQKLLLVNKIKTYAVDRLGIAPSNNYTSMYDQRGKPLMWVVTASKPFELEANLWKFPLIGSFPYKGFFDLEMALEETDRLASQGLDVGIRNAGGWSTLGWFEDPILSDMLDRNEGELAELIFHELTHLTLFVKDSIKFNENLASFVGQQGAMKFLKEQYGDTSQVLQAYLNSEKDYDQFVNHMINGAYLLDSLYHTFEEEISVEEKLIAKKNMIDEIVHHVDTIAFNDPKKYHHLLNSDSVNNTHFLSYLRYRSKQNVFLEEFLNTFDSNVRDYIAYYRNKYPAD